MRTLNHAPCDLDVLGKRFVRSIDHHTRIKAGIDTVVARFLVTVIEMNGKDRIGENIRGGTDDRFEHPLVGVFSGALRNLNDERRLALDAAAEEAHRLFGVVDVVSADGEFAVGDFVKLCGSDDHRR
jgi:hypothetical protein